MMTRFLLALLVAPALAMAAPEDCANGTDDDGDDQVDCIDTACIADVWCGPCTQALNFSSGPGPLALPPAFVHESTPTPVVRMVGPLPASPPVVESFEWSVAVPPLSQGPAPTLELVYSLQGDPNPFRDYLVVCANNAGDCKVASASLLLSTSGNTVPGQNPALPSPAYNDGTFDHAFIDLAAFAGQTVTLSIGLDSNGTTGGARPGLLVRGLTVASDVDRDGASEAAAGVCDACWDADLDGFLDPASPGLGGSCGASGPDCDDTDALTNPAAQERCAEAGDEDCDGLFNALDVGSCGIEDCANGVDDNQDGLVDCADATCTTEAACAEPCATVLTLNRGGSAFVAADNDPDGSGATRVFEYGEGNPGERGWWTALTGKVADKQSAPGATSVRATLTRSFVIPAGLPSPTLVIDYRLDGEATPGRDVFGVCFNTLASQCFASAAPGLIAFKTDVDGPALATKVVAIPLPPGSAGKTVSVTIFYDTVTSEAGGTGRGLFVGFVSVGSDIDTDGDFENSAVPTCDRCVDADSDGFGSSAVGSVFVSACPQALTDCDDDDALTSPSAAEACDVFGDQDCDGFDDDDEIACSECGDGAVTAGEECDDNGTGAGDGCDSLCQVEAGVLAISELHVTRLTEGGFGEQWIEVYNRTGAAIDLVAAGAAIERETGQSIALGDCAIVTSPLVAGGDYAVISLGSAATSDGLLADFACNLGLQLDPTGDLVRLKLGGTTVDVADFRSFGCEIGSAVVLGTGRSLQRSNPGVDLSGATAWCMAAATASYATSGKHFGTPGSAATCAERACDGLDDDCDGTTDELLADGDGDGRCNQQDCDPVAATCTTDCVTDTDTDGTPDCKDGCLDADADGYGVKGGLAVSSCLGADCEDTLNFVNPGKTEGPGAAVCLNGVDDDCDAKPECTDTDCRTTPACAGEACGSPRVIACGGDVTLEPESNDFTCGAGADALFAFTAPSTGSVTLRIDNLGAQQYRAAVQSTTCTDLACGASTTTVETSCQVGGASSFPVTVGTTYFAVVDQVAACAGSGAAPVRVRLQCGELCTGGIDEDVDGLKDCADSDCVANAACANQDLDGDLATNGAEIICGTSPTSPFSTPSAADVANPDNDAFLSCVDPNDDNDPRTDAQEAGCAPGAQADATVYPGAPRQCGAAGVDADCNGAIDALEAACGSQESQCANEKDDDADGTIDCLDTDCLGSGACKSLDFDGDGVSNGFELACGISPQNPLQEPSPAEAADTDGDEVPNCADQDDDGDGAFDLVELACGSSPIVASQKPTDTDGDGQCDAVDPDDDDDGAPDLLEVNCATNTLSATETPTSPAFDLDSDGTCDARDLDIDQDGWENDVEETCGSDPADDESSPPADGLDGDSDGLCDALDSDDDGDGWNDDEEALCLTPGNDGDKFPSDIDQDGTCDLFDIDTDDDGWPDALEVQCSTSPLLASSNPTLSGADTDGDKLCDKVDADDDGDGWSDVAEGECATDPREPGEVPTDTDGDRLCDLRDDDDDDDGAYDTTELLCGTDPLDLTSIPADADVDGLCDPLDPDGDVDGDGWSNQDELACGTDAKKDSSTPVDTDSDLSCDALDLDDDGDSWSDLDEVACGTLPLASGSVPADVDSDDACDPLDLDDDGDGAVDLDELACGTNPKLSTDRPFEADLVDTDGDLALDCVDEDDDDDDVLDTAEVAYGSSTKLSDTDGDGLADGVENANRDGVKDLSETSAIIKDSDGDGLSDGLEASSCYADPCEATLGTAADTDGDGLQDGLEDADGDGETSEGETNPTVSDTDGDGDDDGEETLCGTSPTDPSSNPVDKDQSGICDGAEADTDGDGVADGVEQLCGTDPKKFTSVPSLASLEDSDIDDAIDCADADDDGDLVSDEDELECGTDPLLPVSTPTPDDTLDTDDDGVLDCADPDQDGDGLDADAEALWETDPKDADSDDDGLADGDEVERTTTDPNTADTDGDGVQDGTELGVTAGTSFTGEGFIADADPTSVSDPKNPDTDGDGLTDGVEDACSADAPGAAACEPANRHNGRVDPGEGNPLDAGDGLLDTDADGLIDREELAGTRNGQPNPTDPNDTDSDDDGLNDKLEVDVYGSDPNDTDTDDGGILDGPEVENGTDPNVASDDFSPSKVIGDNVFGCTTTDTGDLPIGGLLAFGLFAAAMFWRRSRKAGLALTVGVVGGFAPNARAQATGAMNVENFSPVGGRYRIFTVEEAPSGPKWQPYAHVLFHGERESFQVSTGNRTEVLVDTATYADINLGIGLFGFMQLDIGLPLALEMSSAPDVTAIAPIARTDGAGLGDLVMRLKGAAVDSTDGGYGLAFSLGLSFPTGDEDRFRGDPGVGVHLAIINELRSTYATLALNVGTRIRSAEATFLNGTYSHELTYGLGVDVGAWPSHVHLGFEVFGKTPLEDPFSSQESSGLEGMFGVRWWVVPNLAIEAGAAVGLVQGVGTPAFRFLTGVSWAPRESDGDGDGIDDAIDVCPLEAEDKDGYADLDGCPEADNDGDGVADADDQCPQRAEDMNGLKDDDGCPDSDVDGDGKLDVVDRCPDAPEDPDGYQDDDGCPEADNDGDGVLDGTDQCPVVAEPETAAVRDGCPDEIAGSGGAPPPEAADDPCGFAIAERVVFDRLSWSIDAEARNVIGVVAGKIKERMAVADAPPVVEVSVNGHTVNEGESVDTLALSLRRARAVRDALVSRGLPRVISPARGFGDQEILSDEGASRRVEVKLTFGGRCDQGGGVR